jgi:hypothetical protein
MCCPDTQNQGRINLKMSMLGSDILGTHGDEKVFLFLSINKLNEPLGDEIIEDNLLIFEFLEIIITDHRFAILQDDEWPAGTTPVGVDDDVAIELFVRTVHFSRENSLSPHGPYLLDKSFRIIHETDESTINENS